MTPSDFEDLGMGGVPEIHARGVDTPCAPLVRSEGRGVTKGGEISRLPQWPGFCGGLSMCAGPIMMCANLYQAS